MDGITGPPRARQHVGYAEMARFQAHAEDAINCGEPDEWPQMILALLVRVRRFEGKCTSTQMPQSGTPLPPDLSE